MTLTIYCFLSTLIGWVMEKLKRLTILLTWIQNFLGKKVLVKCSDTKNGVVVVKSLSRVRLKWPMDSSPPGSSVHGILQAVMEWFAISFSRESSRPRDQTWISCTAGRLFTNWATREAFSLVSLYIWVSKIWSSKEKKASLCLANRLWEFTLKWNFITQINIVFIHIFLILITYRF